MQHVGNNCTPDIASVVSVTTTEDVQNRLKFSQGLRDIGIPNVPDETEFAKELRAAPFCTVEFDNPKPNQGARVVVVQGRNSASGGVAYLLSV